MSHTFNSVVGQEVDDDSDYEEEPITEFTEVKYTDSAGESRVSCHNFLPGALAT